jgi:hypothetical protein
LPIGPRGAPRGHDDVRVVKMVNFTLTGEAPFGVTLVDENEHVEPGG